MDATTDDAASISIELDKVLVTATVGVPTDFAWFKMTEINISGILKLSLILYGRQAFPENCFRKLSTDDLNNPQATHEHLLRSGRRLSYKDDPLQYLSAGRETLVYLRECNNPRLHSLLANLDQIFVALADGLVGKIYICFNDTKEWTKDSLLECYTLQFTYTDQGGLHAYAHWAGKGDAPLKESFSENFFQSVKQLVLGRPQLPDPFYTRFFVSAVDRQTELQGFWAGDGRGVREALLHLKGKEGSSSCRIGMFTSAFTPQEAAQETAQNADGTDDQSLPEVSPRATTPSLPEMWSSPTVVSGSSNLNRTASPARPSSMNNGGRLQKFSNISSYRQSGVDTTSLPRTSPYPGKGDADVFSTEGHGQDAGDEAQEPLRRNPKKRSAPQDQIVAVTQTSKGRTKVAARHPRLAMIEEIPEDLPPTQRLQTPSQNRHAQRSMFANPDCLSSDSEECPSPLASCKTPPVLRNAWEAPEEMWQAADQSRSPQKANTARLYGSRSKRGGKRAHTMA